MKMTASGWIVLAGRGFLVGGERQGFQSQMLQKLRVPKISSSPQYGRNLFLLKMKLRKFTAFYR